MYFSFVPLQNYKEKTLTTVTSFLLFVKKYVQLKLQRFDLANCFLWNFCAYPETELLVLRYCDYQYFICRFFVLVVGVISYQNFYQLIKIRCRCTFVKEKNVIQMTLKWKHVFHLSIKLFSQYYSTRLF